MSKFNQATLRLFNAIQTKPNLPPTFMIDKVLQHTIKNGWITDDKFEVTTEILANVNYVFGFNGQQANATFHKSWKIIQESSMEALVAQQMVHYITTYGFEALGVYNENTVYIPAEELEIPEITDAIGLTVIHGLTDEEILIKIVLLDATGIALHETTLNDIMTIIVGNKYVGGRWIRDLKNRELKTRLMDYYKIVPTEPVEFLRYLISKLTDESLLIKNDYLISKIKESNGKFLDELMLQAPSNLGSIFLRYKSLFLAMRSISKDKTVFNRLRRDAKRMHKPLPFDYLNSVTSLINRDALMIPVLKEHLKTATIFRKIRLAYALNFRLKPCKSIIYKVRTGRGWATDFNWNWVVVDKVKEVLDVVIASISSDLSEKLRGKVIYIPEYINYTLPATEKQFTGNFPSGTYVSVPDNMVAGIHWKNVKVADVNFRVDLDLSTISVSGKTGWDAGYRSEEKRVLFSGDITSAPLPHGATELFYMKTIDQEVKILTVNYFNYNKDIPVPAKIVLARDKAANFNKKYMLDINKIITSANIIVDQPQTVLGLIAPVGPALNFYFAQTSVGNNITSGDYSAQSREYLSHNLINSIKLRDVLWMSGAHIITELYDGIENDDYIDLSPENIEKNTIIDLLT
jgi:hypothetical protein